MQAPLVHTLHTTYHTILLSISSPFPLPLLASPQRSVPSGLWCKDYWLAYASQFQTVEWKGKKMRGQKGKNRAGRLMHVPRHVCSWHHACICENVCVRLRARTHACTCMDVSLRIRVCRLSVASCCLSWLTIPRTPWGTGFDVVLLSLLRRTRWAPRVHLDMGCATQCNIFCFVPRRDIYFEIPHTKMNDSKTYSCVASSIQRFTTEMREMQTNQQHLLS